MSLSPSTAAYVQRLRLLREDLVTVRSTPNPRERCTRIMTSYAAALNLHRVALDDGHPDEARLLAVSPRLLAAGLGHYYRDVPRPVVDAVADFNMALRVLGEPELSFAAGYLL
jgi:hypothetical protein